MVNQLGPGVSSFAPDSDNLFWLITWIVGIWFVAAEAMFFWLIFRFRARPGVKGQYVTGKEKHLKRWINIPHVLVLVCDVVILVAAIRVWVLIKQTLPPPDRVVRVTGQQWAWTFADPGPDGRLDTADDVRTTDEMNVEVGKIYHFQLEAKDVLHSFFIPAFRMKRDAIPGRYQTMWFEATKPGRYHLFCAEYCGTKHSEMIGWIVAMEPSAFQAWLTGGTGEVSMAAAGERKFQELGCVTCHRSDSEGRGPNLQGLFGRPVQLAAGGTVPADEGYIRESIVNPAAKVVAGYQPIMPAYQGLVTEESLMQLVAFVQSLGGNAAATGGEAPAAGAPAATPSPRPSPGGHP